MSGPRWHTLLRWTIVVPAFLGSLFVMYIGIMFLMGFDWPLTAFLIKIGAPPNTAVQFSRLLTLFIPLCLGTLLIAFSIGYALRSKLSSRFLWSLTSSLLLLTVYVWVADSASPSVSHAAAILAGVVALLGAVWSAMKRRPGMQMWASLSAFALMTVPFGMGWVKAPKQPPSAHRVWSTVLQRDSWQAMNTGSNYSATRQLVFSGDRIIAVFESRSAPYENNKPMSIYKLVSISRNSGEIENSLEFKGSWGSMPDLFATAENKVLFNDGRLRKLNPDLTETGMQFEPSNGRIDILSPDGKFMAWETFPGVTILGTKTLKTTGAHLSESAPTSASSHSVLTDNVYWYGDYPNDHSFITLTNAKGQHLLYHGQCGGRAEFLSDDRVLSFGCGSARVMDTNGRIMVQQPIPKGNTSFAGVSRDGSRFAVQFCDSEGDPQYLLYERFIIYETATLTPVAKVDSTSLPERQSWSAFSPDGHYFAAGNPKAVSLYAIP